MKVITKKALNSMVEDHLNLIVRDSITMQHKTKRPRRSLDASSINLALACLQQTNPSTINTPIINKSNKKVDLNALLTSEIPIPPPSEIGMTMHWLSVDGVQPTSSLNPQLQTQKDVQQNINEQEQSREATKSSSVALRQLLPRLVTDELQLYFTRITHAISTNPDAAITRLSQDTGIQELIPFFVQYMTKSVHQNIKHTGKCQLMIHCIDALIRNCNVHLELFLDQILPSVLTCIVASKIGAPHENHWLLRDEASDVLCRICNQFGDKYGNLRGKVIQILCKALVGEELGRCYGAIIAITMFGPKAVDAFILPLVEYWSIWTNMLETSIGEQRYGLQRCRDALLYALAVYNVTDVDKSNSLEYSKLSDIFGNALVPLLHTQETQYADCFI
mmetsp:Transcript_9359/g.13999  ORF Transcript_9359/g.13999 Transcript_9359/m.13999 type:complete len:391 (-) Transcript_9359:177-1349(-)